MRMNDFDDLETLMSQAPRLEAEKVGESLQRFRPPRITCIHVGYAMSKFLISRKTIFKVCLRIFFELFHLAYCTEIEIC